MINRRRAANDLRSRHTVDAAMLRRDSFKRHRRPLRRAKSTNSIPHSTTFDLHRDPALAEREAYIAARLSYQRAHGGASEGMATDLYDLDHIEWLERDDQDDGHCKHDAESLDGRKTIRHQRSIRFAGPNGLYRRSPAPRSIITTESPDSSTLDSIREASSTLPYRDYYGSLRPSTAATPASQRAGKSRLMPSYNSLRKSKSWFTMSEDTIPEGYPATRYGAHERTAHHGISRSDNNTAAAPAFRGTLPPVDGPSRLRRHPALYAKSKSLEADTPITVQRTLRGSSSYGTSLVPSITTGPSIPPRHGSLRNKARKVSTSVRSRIAGLFSGQGSFAGVSDGNKTDSGSDSSDGTVRVTSVGASEDAYAVDVAQDDKSRVTSWTDSETHPAGSEVESDYGNEELPGISESNNTAQECLPNPSLAAGAQYEFKVDSQRVYSALMKRVQENEMRTIKRRTSTDVICYDPAIRPQDSESHTHCSGLPKYTIRHVRSEDNGLRTSWHTGTHGKPGVPNTMPRPVRPKSPVSYTLESEENTINPWTETAGIPSDPGSRASSPPIGKHRQLHSERSSAFFASPTSHLFRTASPYRRALQQSMKEADMATRCETSDGLGAGYLQSLSALSLPTRRTSIVDSEGHNNTGYASSVYSASPRWGHEEAQARPASRPTHTPLLGHVREHAEIESPSRVYTPFSARTDTSPVQSPPRYPAPISMLRNQDQWIESGPRQHTPMDENAAPFSFPERLEDIVYEKGPPQALYPTHEAPLSDKPQSFSTNPSPSPAANRGLLRRQKTRSQLTPGNPGSHGSPRGLAQAVEDQFGKADSTLSPGFFGKHTSGPDPFREPWGTGSRQESFHEDYKENQAANMMANILHKTHLGSPSRSARNSTSSAFI